MRNPVSVLWQGPIVIHFFLLPDNTRTDAFVFSSICEAMLIGIYRIIQTGIGPLILKSWSLRNLLQVD